MKTPAEIRNALGASPSEMARLVGTTPQLWAKWEKGQDRRPSGAARRHLELLLWLYENEPRVYLAWRRALSTKPTPSESTRPQLDW